MRYFVYYLFYFCIILVNVSLADECGSQCTTEIYRQICDASTASCVECLVDSHCGNTTMFGSKSYCHDKVCVQCISNTNCNSVAPICDTNKCVQCLSGKLAFVHTIENTHTEKLALWHLVFSCLFFGRPDTIFRK